MLDLPDGFELDHLEAALSQVTGFRTAIDGGAHRGIWTAEMADHFNKVYAFEPIISNRERIPILDNIIIDDRALYHSSGRLVTMLPGAENTGEWHIGTGGAPVSTFAIDDLNLDDLDFLKLDVEGVELFALQGARKTILRCLPTICIEEKWHCQRYGIPLRGATRFLETLGMNVYKQMGRDVILTF